MCMDRANPIQPFTTCSYFIFSNMLIATFSREKDQNFPNKSGDRILQPVNDQVPLLTISWLWVSPNSDKWSDCHPVLANPTAPPFSSCLECKT